VAGIDRWRATGAVDRLPVRRPCGFTRWQLDFVLLPIGVEVSLEVGDSSFQWRAAVKSFEVPQGVLFQSLVRWTPDGSALAYILNRDGRIKIWIQPLDGTPPRQLTNFKSDQIFWFEWSPDGRQLGVSRGDYQQRRRDD
jgi:hypothetical protein